MIPRIPPQRCLARRKALVADVDADLVVVSNPRHIFYFGGVWLPEASLGRWGPLFLLIRPDASAILVVHNFAVGGVDQECVNEVEMWIWYDPTKSPGTAIWREGLRACRKRVSHELKGVSWPRVAFEHGSLPSGVLDGVVSRNGEKDITDLVYDLRRSKDEDEVNVIQAIVDSCGAGHAAARDAARPGMTELELYGEIQMAIENSAGQQVNLICDLIAGERTEHMIGVPGMQRFQEGDAVIIDLNPVVSGYRADYTATIILTDELTKEEGNRERALHNALEAGEAMLTPGSVAGDVYRAVDEAIRRSGYGEGLTHHAGHGLGLGHPEAPFFVSESRELVRAGDVVTLEPGIYGDGYGARIEHNYLVTNTGPKRLSSHATGFVG